MKHGVLGLVAIGLATLCATQAQARLMNAALPILNESSHAAVHRPTGCQAKVVLRDDKLIHAHITDPSCLPTGVQARDVPGTLFDFLVTPK